MSRVWNTHQPSVTFPLSLRYVLLKEKNMLLTLEQEARRQRVQMPSPERLRKVSVISLPKPWVIFVFCLRYYVCCLDYKLELSSLSQVERSMIRLETVVTERETALRLLQTGQEKGRPGTWRRNIFGYVYWWVWVHDAAHTQLLLLISLLQFLRLPLWSHFFRCNNLMVDYYIYTFIYTVLYIFYIVS